MTSALPPVQAVLHAPLDEWLTILKLRYTLHDCDTLATQITRVCGDRDRLLLFRGWSRLCLHAASLNAQEAASADATAAARAARAAAMDKEATAATERAKALQQMANASAEIAAVKEHTRQHAAGVSTVTAELKQRAGESEQLLKKQQQRWCKTLVSTLLFRRNLFSREGRVQLLRLCFPFCMSPANPCIDDVLVCCLRHADHSGMP